MRNVFTAALVVGSLAMVPVAGFAATPAKPQAQSAGKPSRAATATVAGRAMNGVVKSVDASSLVIARSGKKAGEMSFVLSPSTQRDGAIEIGSPVSVRYREDGKTHVATAVTAQHPTQQAAHAAATKK